jgi:hypothetical protein
LEKCTVDGSYLIRDIKEIFGPKRHRKIDIIT